VHETDNVEAVMSQYAAQEKDFMMHNQWNVPIFFSAVTASIYEIHYLTLPYMLIFTLWSHYQKYD
jgi:hypothetical protein